jgi:6-carboxyhexanoate--CoA ligase
MRASRKVGRTREEHISGAETLCSKRRISGMAQIFVNRAVTHPRGMPDRIVLTIEKITTLGQTAPILPFTLAHCTDPASAQMIAHDRLRSIGISARAIAAAFRILTAGRQMRGAALLDAVRGVRLEPDRNRGVRASRLGMRPADCRRFIQLLETAGINTDTVREAMMLASKIAAHPAILAELCISDDPDYTTGYVASKNFGYIRLPNIKTIGSPHGGRVFFVRPGADIQKIVSFLEQTPVLLTIRPREKREE